MDKAKTLKELERVLGYIERGDNLTQEEMKTIEKDTINNYNEYFNTGWMDFRKSCTPDGATIEWASEGEHVYDVYGNEFIDCIGGFGTYIAGHRNPDVVKYVKAQLDRLTLSSTELIEPLRGYTCEALAMITPGDLKFSYLTNGGAEAVEMALKLAMLANGPGYFISTVHGFHGKSLGALSMTGNATFRERYYPNLLRMMMAFFNKGLGYDRYAEIFDQKQEYGKKMKDKVDVVILVGKQQTSKIYEGLEEVNFDMNNVHIVDNVKEAFNLVYREATPEDTILLENDLPDAFSH